MARDKEYNRREFINRGARFTLGLSLAGVGVAAAVNAGSEKYLWQIDPFKCTQCGRCATDCVLSPSAVKCVHAYDICGYCDLCGGYFKPGVTDLDTGAEKQLCPAAAIERKFIEEPYFEYIIDEELCIGCAKCVKGCSAFGNGSLHLQIRHDICVNCNECSIARVCPSDAISRVPASEPYMIKGDFTANESGEAGA
ncbi:MAG: ferredoxin [Bacteroidales bacterium]|nr:ferredoxin [Bacteroidales bacterium]MDT8430465.1 ferredoxin [Bacteroidales bacterium]